MATPYHVYSSRNHFVEPPSIVNRIAAAVPAVIATRIQKFANPQSSLTSNVTHLARGRWRQQVGFRALLSLPNVFILIWLVALLWGERWAFNDSVAACDWRSWEQWVSMHLYLEGCELL